MKATVTTIYVACFACRGTGKEPDYIGQRTCIWCGGRGRVRPKYSPDRAREMLRALREKNESREP